MAEWLAWNDSGPPLRHDQRGFPRLVLASASPARLRTLRAAGIEPVVQPAEVDESGVVHRARAGRNAPTPTDEALVLARAKAEAIAAAVSGVVILGCDSVLELDGIPYGKPSGP